MNLPQNQKEWRQLIEDVLGRKRYFEMQRILKASNRETLQPNLRDYYGTFRKELERKGLVVEYLAYATEYAFQTPAPKGKT